MKEFQDTYQISPGHRSNTDEITPKIKPSNISRTPIKYLQDTDQIFAGHP